MVNETDPGARQRSDALHGRGLLPEPGADGRAGAPDGKDGLEFETIVRQAAAAMGTPMALISLLDGERQWFKAKVGITLSDTPIASSFCAHAIRGSGVLTVSDARVDERFAANPLVTGRPNIRFYAGTALKLDGVRVGTLCVLDDQPRTALTALQQSYLSTLADRVMAAFEARERR